MKLRTTNAFAHKIFGDDTTTNFYKVIMVTCKDFL